MKVLVSTVVDDEIVRSQVEELDTALDMTNNIKNKSKFNPVLADDKDLNKGWSIKTNELVKSLMEFKDVLYTFKPILND